MIGPGTFNDSGVANPQWNVPGDLNIYGNITSSTLNITKICLNGECVASWDALSVDYYEFCSCNGTGYENHNVNGDIVYVDCNADKCWTPTAGSTYKWGSAYSYCDTLNYGGFTDWILPDIATLRNLCYSNSCSGTCFVRDGSTSSYWSSTEYNTDCNYYVHFGSCGQNFHPKTHGNYIRCTRD